MKLLKLFSKLTAVFLSSVISVSFLSVSTYAVDNENFECVYLDDYEMEVSLEELADKGVEAILYYDDTTQSVSVYNGDFLIAPLEVTENSLGSFHVGLTFNKYQDSYNLHWQINLSQLTYMSAEVYCKDTAVFFPTVFFEDVVTQRFNGSSSLGFGGSSYFDIPSGYDKVRVGWKNCTLSSVTDTYYIGDDSGVVTLSDLI
ncbi:MAG: hypothetical protein NC340_02140 [Ruminococcus flavefaciens]|nr:hypothetical protein [Ruminococcus flavefaciens]MCM1228947.1 hypothetical protein [Ruminococcus flavefaciens]